MTTAEKAREDINDAISRVAEETFEAQKLLQLAVARRLNNCSDNSFTEAISNLRQL